MRAFTGYEKRERERYTERRRETLRAGRAGEKDGKRGRVEESERRGETQRRRNRAMDPAGKGF